MRWMVFLARVTFICNICYLIFVVGRYVDMSKLHQSIVGTVVVMGFTAVFLNVVTNLFWLVAVIRKKPLPIILGVLNFLFLVFQILNILFLDL
jgi:hypothetical protein